MNVKETLKKQHITAPAVLLFMALFAQAPHATAVFIRIAPHTTDFERYVSWFGGVVYAIALEGATAFFVWRNQRKWAIAFAVFSVAHNIAYYMPAAWAVDFYGATLVLRDVFGALLISISLPIAIAAFSHVQGQQEPQEAEQDQDAGDEQEGKPEAQGQEPTQEEASKPAPVLRKVGKVNEYGITDTQLAEMLGVARQRIPQLRDGGTLAARVAKELPQLAAPTTNGKEHV